MESNATIDYFEVDNDEYDGMVYIAVSGSDGQATDALHFLEALTDRINSDGTDALEAPRDGVEDAEMIADPSDAANDQPDHSPADDGEHLADNLGLERTFRAVWTDDNGIRTVRYLYPDPSTRNRATRTRKIKPDSRDYQALWLCVRYHMDHGAPFSSADIERTDPSDDSSVRSCLGRVADAGLIERADKDGRARLYAVTRRGGLYVKNHGEPTGDYEYPDIRTDVIDT